MILKTSDRKCDEMDPLTQLRRTPLRRLLDAKGATWRALGDSAVAEMPDGTVDVGQLAIVDLTPLPRLGFKGRGTIEAMKSRGVTVEAEPNRVFRQADGGLCLVLAPGEVVLLAPLSGDGAKLDQMLAGWKIEDEERTYPLLRRDSHAWFAVTGTAAPSMFAKICGIDLRRPKFPDLTIAQTSVAKMSAIIARADLNNLPLYHILADSAAALYFHGCLLDAAHEFGGRVAGLRNLQDAARDDQAIRNQTSDNGT
jgi:sarcosine oxidase subunit gamma